MDFVLLGFGTGALLILAGRGIRAYGPRFRGQQRDPDAPFREFAASNTWRRYCRGIGLVASLGGLFLCALTLLLLLANVSDRAGMVVLTLSLLALLIAAGIWAALFTHPAWRSRERTSIVAPSRRRQAPASGATSDVAAASWTALDQPVEETNGREPDPVAEGPSRTTGEAERTWPDHHPFRRDERERSPEAASSRAQ